MTNAQIVEIVKLGNVVLQDKIGVLGVAKMSKDDFCNCHNIIASSIDEAMWKIAEGLGFDGDYEDFINMMISYRGYDLHVSLKTDE